MIFDSWTTCKTYLIHSWTTWEREIPTRKSPACDSAASICHQWCTHLSYYAYLTIHTCTVHVRLPAVAHSSDSYLMIHIFVSDSISLVDNVHGYGLCWTELFACCIAFGMNSQGILDLKRILGFGLVIIFLGSSMYLVLSSKQLERLLMFVFHAHCA